MDTTLTRSDQPADTTAVVEEAAPRGNRWRTTWVGIRAGVGALLGLVPHVMHHIGILAGTAFLTGMFGNSVLYVTGLVLSIPLLKRLRKRFGRRRAPIIGVGVFTAMFLVSALVVGPAINRTGAGPDIQPPAQQAVVEEDHDAHHGG